MRRINGAIACYITNLLSGPCGASTAMATHWMMSGYDCLNKNASTVNGRWTVGLPQQHQLVAYCRCVELQRLGCRLLTVWRAVSPSFSSVFAKHTSAWDNHVLCQIFNDLKNVFTHRLINKLFLIWLFTTLPHLKYVATLPCNLSLMACFADINVSQGSVATYARCGRIFDIHLTANVPWSLPVKIFFKIC